MKKIRKEVRTLAKDPLCECISRMKKWLPSMCSEKKTTTSAVCPVRNCLHWVGSGSRRRSENSLLNIGHTQAAKGYSGLPL